MHDEFRSAECRGDPLRKALIKALETQLLRKLDRFEKNVFSLSPHVDFLISAQLKRRKGNLRVVLHMSKCRPTPASQDFPFRECSTHVQR